jgi:uncharacterized protein with NRDE domain
MAILAPIDLEAGGTWIGLNAAGVFAGITNRIGSPPDPSRRSRGELVFLALGEPSAEQAAERIRALDPRLHNPYNLVLADREHAALVVSTGGEASLVELEPGLHIATEASFEPGRIEPLERERLVRSRYPIEAPPSNEALAALLSVHADPPPSGTCVHLPEFGYGTRSSTIVRLLPGGRTEFLHAEGTPCKASFVSMRVPAAG